MSESDTQLAGVLAMLASLPTDPNQSMQERRPGLDAFGDLFQVPEGCTVEAGSLGGVACEWHSHPAADPARVILYVHGGGYCIGSSKSHRHMVARLAQHAGTVAVSLDYRMAPEVPFPGAIDDALAAYKALLDQGFKPGCIAISGDSAGGGLSIATAMAIRDAGLSQPAALYPISPWADLAQEGATCDSLAHKDPMLSRESLQAFANAYLGSVRPQTVPTASPLHGDLGGLAPMFVQVGGAEVLMSDSIRLAEKVGVAGGEFSLEIWPDMIHIWPIFFPMLDAGDRALQAGAAFIRRKMSL
jgi:monoterpene epsilon-lactone hydrolase